MIKRKNRFKIICDSRERTGWTFDEDKYCQGSIVKGLKTGDYSVEGLENILCIERKRNTAELSQNMHEPRFQKELDRILKFEYKFMLLEFDYEDVLYFPLNSGLPPAQQKKTQVTANYLKYYLAKLQVNYGINLMYCGNAENAKAAAYEIMKTVFFKEEAKNVDSN